MWSDGGPQFTSIQFKQFAQQWGFLHKTSSPYHPQSNGKIESTVKSMKKIIRTSWNSRSLNQDKFCRSLLQYRNTPSRRDIPQPRSSMATLPKTPFLPIIVHFHKNGNRKWKKLKGKLMPRKNPSPPTITLTLIPSQKLKLALTWPSKILAPTLGHLWLHH